MKLRYQDSVPFHHLSLEMIQSWNGHEFVRLDHKEPKSSPSQELKGALPFL